MRATTIDVHVDQVLQAVFGIMRACGVSEDMLSGSISRVLESSSQAETVESLSASLGQHLACTEIVYTWRRASQFLDACGVPKILSIRGEGSTFESLSRLAANNYRWHALLEYLESLGAVRVTENGVELLTDSVLAYCFGESRRISPETVLSHIVGFLGTVQHNITRSDSPGRSRFERACYMPIPKNLLPVFERLVEVRGQNFVDTIDEWLARHRAEDGNADDVFLVGAGAYALAHSSKKFKTLKSSN